ncbi:MAG: response regulator transcription factor [Pseudomonadota bacterium]
MSQRILVVDDDPQITRLLKRVLDRDGYETTCVGSGLAMRQVLSDSEPDLCILDIGLPDTDGMELLDEIRATSGMPVIFLSVRDQLDDRVLGLEHGADDYICKPFEPRELTARIRTVLRRNGANANGEATGAQLPSLIQLGDWVLNPIQRTVTDSRTDGDAQLTSMEFDLLRALVENPRESLTREELIRAARGSNAFISDRNVDVHIMRLRKKIEPDPSQPRYVKTIHGVGYCLTETPRRLAS